MSDSSHNFDARRTYAEAVSLHRQDKLAEAERHYLAVRKAFPGHPGVLHGLGLICLRTHRSEEAAAFLERATRAAPNDATIRCDLGTAWLLLGRYADALRCFDATVAARPDDIAAQMGRADVLSILGRQPEARAAFENIIERNPAHAAAHFGLGNLLVQIGDTAGALRAFEKAIALAPKRPAYHRALAETERFSERDPRLTALEALSHEEDGLSADQKVELHFALAKAYDDLNRYADAFAHLRKANDIKRSLVEYDQAAVASFFQQIADTFTPDHLQSKRGAGDPSDLPVFIVGMPRSGSTLVEQILASHPSVFGAGELLYVNDLIASGAAGEDYPSGSAVAPDAAFRQFGNAYVTKLRALAPQAERIVDKLPANFRHLGLLYLALPNARIIHVRRDPVDTCFSCYSKLFLSGLNFTYDLGELGRYYKLYDALMAHWRAVLPAEALLEVQYETLAGDFETEARRIIAFCGLAWDARCLRFYETERPVRTLSQTQVRQPLFTSSIGRWRRYEPWLGPLFSALR